MDIPFLFSAAPWLGYELPGFGAALLCAFLRLSGQRDLLSDGGSAIRSACALPRGIFLLRALHMVSHFTLNSSSVIARVQPPQALQCSPTGSLPAFRLPICSRFLRCLIRPGDRLAPVLPFRVFAQAPPCPAGCMADVSGFPSNVCLLSCSAPWVIPPNRGSDPPF